MRWPAARKPKPLHWQETSAPQQASSPGTFSSPLEIGDGIAMTDAGSCAAVLSPAQFAFMVPSAQLFLTAEGQSVDRTRKGRPPAN